MEKFLELCKGKHIPFGIHSPLMSNGSKYDLIEEVEYEPEFAWRQLESEAKIMSKSGAEYLLVHFPYFKEEITDNANELIEEGLKKLSSIQEKYSIELVCEPKLGFQRSPAGINYLQNFPKETWEKYNIKLCIDIGDYIIAVGDKIFDYLTKWKEFIKVVHLHNIFYEGDKYIWIPVHPSQESDNQSYKVKDIITFLAQCEDVTFVFEYTPHTNPSKEFVREGFKWVEELIKK
jgi:sugar phosphate isomerase/epimerase